MTYEHDLVDRAVQVLSPEEPSFEGLLRRRDRKRRNQRLAAGAIGLAIGLGVIAIGASFLRSARVGDPAEWPLPSITPTRVVQEDEVLIGPPRTTNPTYVIAADVSTGAERTVAGCEAGCRLLFPFDTSADGGWIAYHLANCEQGECGPSDPEGGLWVVDAEDPPRFVAKGFLDTPWSWSPTGAQLAYADVDELILLDPTTWKHTPIATAGGTIHTIAWGPDGRSIAYSVDLASGEATPAGSLGVFVIRSGKEPRQVSAALGTTGITWSPDGSSLVLDRISSDRSLLEVVAADGSNERVLVEGSAFEAPGSPVWSPDGSRIAYLRTPGNSSRFALEFWVIGADGRGEVRLARFEGTHDLWDGPVWSPDSQLIAFQSNVSGWVTVAPDGRGSPQPIDRLEVERWRQG